MFTDSTCPDSSCKYRNRRGYCTATVCVAVSKSVAIQEKTKTPTIGAVPLEPLCEWLAANASYVFGGYTKNTWKFEARHWEHEIREWMKNEGLNANALLEQMNYRKEYVDRQSDPVCLAEDAPPIDTVSIKAISEWLAGYAAPPEYALKTFPESERCLANTLAAAWEHHIRTMIECWLIEKINEKKEE